MKNKPLIEPTSYSLSQTLSSVKEPSYIVQLSEYQPDGGPLLNLKNNSYGQAMCDTSYDNNITIIGNYNTFAKCKKDSSGGYIDCYDIGNKQPSNCCNFDAQGLAYLYGEPKTNTLTCSEGTPPNYGYNILTSQCDSNGKDGSKNNYSSKDVDICNAAYKINVGNSLAQKINFPPIPPFNNKKNDYSILTSPYYRYSKEFYNVSQGTTLLINIYLMTEIASMTACWDNTKIDQNGLYAFMDCSEAYTHSGTNYAPCQNGINYEPVGLGDLQRCTNSSANCTGTPYYTSDDTRYNKKCREFAYGKFGYVSSDVNNNIYNGFTVLPNLLDQPTPQPLQLSIVPVMGYESKNGGKTYVLTNDPKKIRHYCLYKIQVGLMGALFAFKNGDNNYPVKFQMYDPTDWVNNASKYSAYGLFAFSTIPKTNNPQKVGLVAVDPNKLNNTNNYNYWDSDGNLDDVSDSDKSQMNLINQVYPFLDHTMINEHLGWLSFINANQLVGIRAPANKRCPWHSTYQERCGTVSGASYLWVQQDPEESDINFKDKIVSGYTRP